MPRLADPKYAPDCHILFDGDAIPARAGESVTSALLAAGRSLVSRSAKYHRPRGPFCLASSCASCLVRIDGAPNIRACETPCRDGMRVETQNAMGGAAHDLLGVIDLLSPGGLDHHHMATWSQLANKVAVTASRQLTGLGLLPDQPPAPALPATQERYDALVVGAGPAGLAAAEALARAGLSVLVAEQERAPGGRLRCRLDLPGDPPFGWIAEVEAAVRAAGGEIAVRAAAIAVWRDGPDVLTALTPRGASTAAVRVVRAARLVLASGGWAQPALFSGNDLPGIHGLRGLLAALAEDGVVPGEHAAVLGDTPEAEAAVGRLAAAGMLVQLVQGGVAKALGSTRLKGLELEDGRRVRCDVLAVATPRMPAAELARELGAPLTLDPGTGAFRVSPAADGSFAPGAWAAGELCGPCTAGEAAGSGRAAGLAAAAWRPPPPAPAAAEEVRHA
jgi:sarcosine oxidase subunit alpha